MAGRGFESLPLRSTTAHDWRTAATSCVLCEDNAEAQSAFGEETINELSRGGALARDGLVTIARNQGPFITRKDSE